jgi:predicted amidophosphoribosyltransferase
LLLFCVFRPLLFAIPDHTFFGQYTAFIKLCSCFRICKQCLLDLEKHNRTSCPLCRKPFEGKSSARSSKTEELIRAYFHYCDQCNGIVSILTSNCKLTLASAVQTFGFASSLCHVPHTRSTRIS